MKKSTLKSLIKTIQSEIKGLRQEMSGDADDQIKKAKKIVVDKLKNNTELSQPESELAVSSTDSDEKKKMSANVAKTSSLKEDEDSRKLRGSGKQVKTRKELKSKSGVIIQPGTIVSITFKENSDQNAYIEMAGLSLNTPASKPYMAIPIKLMNVYFTGCSKMPSMNTLEKASDAGICTTVFGSRVEPDGYDQFGAPSWMLVLGII
jgi:hypothetical protein